ncbi:type IV pilus modification PilV family protein [Engelhardtia mirabilis]|uniref:Uncharacterized protein n=1 Tax=Engelhardtia mirabilis TaxID=2528011 RepID=A0A518BEJ5_9BACT|nr:hypothetical protein Pla133_04790 [Planctomycetes bacterium Pla133]QDU99740.1 hypothetical protein Pla86_04790 [Planctomycetes bacterium Pla86]
MTSLAIGRPAMRVESSPRRSSPPRRAGFTIVELVISMGVMLTAFLIFATTVAGVAQQRTVNSENGIAANAARSMVEIMQNEEFEQIFALYNADPNDDPNGIGSAPGNRFAVVALPPTEDSVDGLVGEIFFPCIEIEVLSEVDVDAPPPTRGQPQKVEVLGTTLALREDVANAQLDTPRDLNGDSIIDEEDHSDDYVILPVRVSIRWRGQHGDREYAIQTIFCRFRRS